MKLNHIKSSCVVFKPKSSKLYCPDKIDCDILEYISCTKYLGFTFNMTSQDDMLRQMRTFYITHFSLLFY